MLPKKSTSVFALLLLACVFIACKQKSNKNAIENDVMRIPVSVNDSMSLSVDKSPMDMIYFPVDFPKEKMVDPAGGNPVARVIYSRPQKKGRAIFADSTGTQNFIQQYGKAWRLGANEATEIEFFKDVIISGQKLAQGRYIIYCIPYSYKWIIIFNDNLYSWGLHFDQTKDIIKTELPVIKNNASLEYLTMSFQEAPHGCNLVMAWGNVKVSMPIIFN